MNILTGLTDSPNQRTVLPLDNGESATLDLYFRPQQRGWFFDLYYNDFTLLGQRLTVGENVMRQFSNQMPFGLSVLSKTGKDPMKQDTFSTSETVFILLNEDDVETVEAAKFTRDD